MLALCLLLGHKAIAQTPGTLDASFGKDGYKILDLVQKQQIGSAIALQPDGKVVAAGMHAHGADAYDWLIYRLNTDGSLDQSFDGDGTFMTSFGTGNSISDLAIQSDGKILVCGTSDFGAAHLDLVVQRLRLDGSVDNSFGQGGVLRLDPSVGADDQAVRILEAPNQKIYLAAQMDILGDVYFMVYRFNSNGTPDSTFGFDGSTFVDMNGPGALSDFAVTPDGSVILGGYVQTNNVPQIALTKLTNTGSLDLNFGNGGLQFLSAGANSGAALFGLCLTDEQKIFGVGIRNSNQNNSLVFRLKANGEFDSTFHQVGYKEYDLGLGSNDLLLKVSKLAHGKFLAMGFIRVNNQNKGVMLQLDTLGNIDVNHYGNGSGQMMIQLSTGNDLIRDFASNNDFSYAIGDFNNQGQSDIFIARSFLSNPLSLIETFLNPAAVKIFPNPARTNESVDLHLNKDISGLVKVEVVNSLGQVVHSEEFFKLSSDYYHPIKLTSPKRGLYTVYIKNGQKSGFQKLIIN